jgi:hypothetical protein
MTVPHHARPMLCHMKVRDIVRRLRQDGWYIDLSILKQAGIEP